MPTVTVDLVFTALADATRRHILEMLAGNGPASASAIASQLPISRQAIAKHLGLLEQAGLVSRSRQGKEVCFVAQSHQLAATGRWMQRLATRWEQDAGAAATASASV